MLAVPVAFLLWTVLTRPYNRFLEQSAENLVRLTERPAVTRLEARDAHYALVLRSDERGALYSIRTTDIHFHLVLLVALFLAVPGVDHRRRLANLGWACLIAVFFHIVLLFLWVKFAYATQLGSWSAAHYGPFARNAYGLAKHLFDLPFKFALPLILWAGFYLPDLRRATNAE